jgi:hypothetical protein
MSVQLAPSVDTDRSSSSSLSNFNDRPSIQTIPLLLPSSSSYDIDTNYPFNDVTTRVIDITPAEWCSLINAMNMRMSFRRCELMKGNVLFILALACLAPIIIYADQQDKLRSLVWFGVFVLFSISAFYQANRVHVRTIYVLQESFHQANDILLPYGLLMRYVCVAVC